MKRVYVMKKNLLVAFFIILNIMREEMFKEILF